MKKKFSNNVCSYLLFLYTYLIRHLIKDGFGFASENILTAVSCIRHRDPTDPSFIIIL